MELFVQLEKNADGSRAFQCGGDMQEGQAYWNTDAVPLPERFPWVEIETAEVSHECTTFQCVPSYHPSTKVFVIMAV